MQACPKDGVDGAGVRMVRMARMVRRRPPRPQCFQSCQIERQQQETIKPWEGTCLGHVPSVLHCKPNPKKSSLGKYENVHARPGTDSWNKSPGTPFGFFKFDGQSEVVDLVELPFLLDSPLPLVLSHAVWRTWGPQQVMRSVVRDRYSHVF